MSITRRHFLRNTAAAGAIGATVAAPAVSEASTPTTPHDQVLWHLRELERLVFEDGALDAHIFVAGHYDEYVEGKARNVKSIGIHHSGRLMDWDGMFAPKGGAS